MYIAKHCTHVGRSGISFLVAIKSAAIKSCYNLCHPVHTIGAGGGTSSDIKDASFFILE
jgi:hypothetical protein